MNEEVNEDVRVNVIEGSGVGELEQVKEAVEEGVTLGVNVPGDAETVLRVPAGRIFRWKIIHDSKICTIAAQACP